MRSFCLFLWLVAVLAAFSALAQSKPPTAPDGFHWQPLPEIKARVLAPDDWFFLNEPHPNVNAYFVTKERIEGNSQFSTGLSIRREP